MTYDLIAVADTNIYRGLSDRGIEELCELEARAGVRPMASFMACSELLAHLTDTASRGYAACRASLRRLHLHCTGGDRWPQLEFIADPFGVIAYSLFNVQHPAGHDLAEKFGGLVQRAVTADPRDLLLDIALDLQRIKRHRDEGEAAFVRFLAGTRQNFGRDPQSPSKYSPSQIPPIPMFFESGMARHVAAGGLVMNVAEASGITLTDAQVDQLARSLLPEAAAAVTILEAAQRRVLCDGAAPENQANCTWDLRFALLAASRAVARSMPVVVITDDEDMLRAASPSRTTTRIMSLAEYRCEVLGALPRASGAKADSPR